MITFRGTFKRLLPSWLTSGDGEKILYVQTLLQDIFLYRAYLGALCGFPSRTPDDGLGKIGQDRLITRGISESRESYVYRLKHYIPALQKMGVAFETIRQIRAYINSPVKVKIVSARGDWFTIDADGTKHFQPYLQNWNWDDTPANVGRLWVIIYSENGPWSRNTYGDGHTYGETGTAWGGTFTPEVAADLVRLAVDWTAQGIMVEHIIVTFDDTLFDPADSATLPDGKWGKPYKYEGGVAVPSRFTGASYIEVMA